MADGNELSKRRAVAYLRVSTEDQRERETILTQRSFLEKYFDLHGIRCAGWYQDDGVSASKPVQLDELPEGARLLADARGGRLSEVYIYKLDRLGRNARLILNGVGELEAAGCRVISATEPFDTETPAGRFMLTMLAAVAALERDNFVQRSAAGADRVARAGGWLGGIAPYGYRVEGRGKDARLRVHEEEAGVVREMYRLTVEEGRSCVEIADRLNLLGVATAYVRDERAVVAPRGKRLERTQGVWRSGRVLQMLKATVYRGVHTYGKRSKREDREVIERAVPPVVDDTTWWRAQEVLRSHFLFNPRGARQQYLLRGLMKCALCGLTYIGTHDARSGKVWYECNGKHNPRARGVLGERCPSRSLSREIEDEIWGDVEAFIREPGPALDELAAGLWTDDGTKAIVAVAPGDLEVVLLKKEEERARVISLYRRGRIGDEDLDRELAGIDAEISHARLLLGEVAQALGSQPAFTGEFRAMVEEWLSELRRLLDEGVTWEKQRRLVELLVERVRVETATIEGKEEAVVRVRYRFTARGATESCKGKRAVLCWTLERAYRSLYTYRRVGARVEWLPLEPG